MEDELFIPPGAHLVESPEELERKRLEYYKLMETIAKLRLILGILLPSKPREDHLYVPTYDYISPGLNEGEATLVRGNSKDATYHRPTVVDGLENTVGTALLGADLARTSYKVGAYTIPKLIGKAAGKTNWGRALYLNRALNSAIEEMPSVIPSYKVISYESPKSALSGYMGLYERAPKRISIAERMGIPKGERNAYHTIAENELFALEANNFALKYGYPKIVYDPSNITTELLNSQVKSMLDRHNTFLRGTVPESPFIEDTEQAIKALGLNYTPELYLIYAATHPRTWGEPGYTIEPSIFVGDLNAHIYGNGKAAAVLYPYKLGKDRSKWLIEGDTPIYYGNGLTAQERVNKGFRGIVSPWEFKLEGISSGGTNELMTISDVPLIFKGWSTLEKPYPIRIPMRANLVFETKNSTMLNPTLQNLEVLKAAKDRMQFIKDNDPYFVSQDMVERDGHYGKELFYGTRNANPWQLAMAEDMKLRITDLGFDMESPRPFWHNGNNAIFRPGTYVDTLAKQPIDLVVMPEVDLSLGGYRSNNGKTVIRILPNTKGLELLSTQIHESLMHGTDDLVEGLGDVPSTNWTIPAEYNDFAAQVLDSRIEPNSNKWYELRATLGELRTNMYKALAKAKGKDFYTEAKITPELRELFNQSIDKMNHEQLASLLENINNYGADYAAVLREELAAGEGKITSSLNLVKKLLKLYPIITVGISSLLAPYLNNTESYKKGGGIHIKKKNRGKFTASAKRAGEGVLEHAHKVVNDPNATTLLKRRAQFAINSKNWSRH